MKLAEDLTKEELEDIVCGKARVRLNNGLVLDGRVWEIIPAEEDNCPGGKEPSASFSMTAKDLGLVTVYEDDVESIEVYESGKDRADGQDVEPSEM